MNIDIIAGTSKQFTGRLRIWWSRLIGDIPGCIAGQRTELAGALQRAHGMALPVPRAKAGLKATRRGH